MTEIEVSPLERAIADVVGATDALNAALAALSKVVAEANRYVAKQTEEVSRLRSKLEESEARFKRVQSALLEVK